MTLAMTSGATSPAISSGWRIGSIFGIPLFLKPAWFYSLILFSLVFSPFWQRVGMEPGLAWLMSMVMTLLLFGSVLLHELGHSLVARSQGIPVRSITLFLLGGIASIEQDSKTPGQAFWVAIAGPAVSFTLFVLLFLLSLSLPNTTFVAILLNRLALINLVLTLFNMIPGLPLDGGQVLKAALWKVTGSRIQGIYWAAKVGRILGWVAIGVGVVGFFTWLRFNFLWVVLLGVFVIRRADAYLHMTTLQSAMLKLQATDAMRTDFRVVDGNQTLQAFMELYLADDPTVDLYYVEAKGVEAEGVEAEGVEAEGVEAEGVEAEGQVLGWITPEALRPIERSLWNQTSVHTVMQTFEQTAPIQETSCLAEVIDQLETQQLYQLPVLSTQGRVVGVIDRADVAQALATQLKLLLPDAFHQQLKTAGQFPDALQFHRIARDALNAPALG